MRCQFAEKILLFAESRESFTAKDLAEEFGATTHSFTYPLGRLIRVGVLDSGGRCRTYMKGPNWANRKSLLKSGIASKKGQKMLVPRGQKLPPDLEERMEKEWHCRKIREYGLARWSAIVNKRPELLMELLG